MSSRLLSALLLALAAFALGCGFRPARFADRPVITAITDDAPIDAPRPSPFIEALYLSDVYVRTGLVAFLDPTRTPEAGDVNAFDEVPRSQWFAASPRRAPDTHDGPPELPLVVLPERADHGPALEVLDSRALRYEIRFDPPDRPEMRTAAAVIANRLARELGYFLPEVALVDLRREDLGVAAGVKPAAIDAVLRDVARSPSGTFRVVATRWPIGIDLGTTVRSETRRDDPNDRVPHRDRRTLRALKAVSAWLGVSRMDSDLLRDAYVGPPGLGHVRHYLVGLDGALGADAVTRAEDEEPEGEGGDPRFWVRLLTLGLSPRRAIVPTQREHPSLGAFGRRVSVDDVDPSPPFEPMSRALPTDLYWVAKRIAAVTPAAIDAAIKAGKLADPVARGRIREALFARQSAVVARGLAAVTPCEVERLDGRTLVLRDAALVFGYARAAATRYEVAFTDDVGSAVAPPQSLGGAPGGVEIALPAAPRGYLVVRVLAVRGAWIAPRAAEIHVVTSGDRPHVVGVVH